jgi:hypothetical protein
MLNVIRSTQSQINFHFASKAFGLIVHFRASIQVPLYLATMVRLMTLILTLSAALTTSVHAYHRGERLTATTLKRGNVRVGGRVLQMQTQTQPGAGVDNNVKPASTVKPTTVSTDMPTTAASAAPSVAPSPAPEPSAFPSRQLDPGSAYAVNLLEFTVWTNGTDTDITTTMFRKLLKKTFKKEFDSFYSVDLQLLTLQISGHRRVLLEELRYAGTATFARSRAPRRTYRSDRTRRFKIYRAFKKIPPAFRPFQSPP